VRTIGTFCAIAICLWLWGCANQAAPPEKYIEQGDAKLLPETIVVGPQTPSYITAFVLINGERKGIAVLSSDCDDGVGSIRVIDEAGHRGTREVYAFARDARPADQLFITLCEARRRQMVGKPHSPQ